MKISADNSKPEDFEKTYITHLEKEIQEYMSAYSEHSRIAEEAKHKIDNIKNIITGINNLRNIKEKNVTSPPVPFNDIINGIPKKKYIKWSPEVDLFFSKNENTNRKLFVPQILDGIKKLGRIEIKNTTSEIISLTNTLKNKAKNNKIKEDKNGHKLVFWKE